MNICVVGAGYAGLVTAACFAEFGLRVVCVDKEAERVGRLREGKMPFYEPGLEEMVQRNMAQERLNFSTEITQGVRQSLVIFICVGTPSLTDGAVDLSAVDEVARLIGENLDGYKLVVTKSTVPVGTTRRVEQIIRETAGDAYQYEVASNPEFLREGAAIEDFMRPDRVVIGAESDQARAILKDLYSPLYLRDTPFVVTEIETSEMIKYACNAFLATKISFINEMANLCEAMGADVYQVARAMGLDKRIGPKFLHPGPGFGGSCFPKDTRALAHFARAAGSPVSLVDTVVEVNQRQRQRMMDKVVQGLGPLADKTVGLLGLTFKPNTDDIREAPAIYMAREILAQGGGLRAYDPAGMEQAARVLEGAVALCADAYEVAEGSDGLVIATEWNQFRNLDFDRLKGLLKAPVLIDLKNIYDPGRIRSKGFRYIGVGRT
jgi:UDPglucose 6-dehydrogenase